MPELRDEMEKLRIRRIKLDSIITTAENKGPRINVKALADLLRADADNLESKDPEVIRATIRRHVPFITANPDGTITVTIGYNFGNKKTAIPNEDAVAHFLAGAEGLEPSTNGFGDHYSTS